MRKLIGFDFCPDSSFVPPLIYAAMGSSRDIAIGPVAVVSVLLGTLLRNELSPKDPNYIKLAFTATFFAGVVQAALGFFRCIDTLQLPLVSMAVRSFVAPIEASLEDDVN